MAAPAGRVPRRVGGRNGVWRLPLPATAGGADGDRLRRRPARRRARPTHGSERTPREGLRGAVGGPPVVRSAAAGAATTAPGRSGQPMGGRRRSLDRGAGAARPGGGGV